MARARQWMVVLTMVLGVGLAAALAAGTGGQVDTSYGSSGVASVGDALILDAEALADGSIVALGQDATTSPATYVVMKLTPAGALDTTFGASGTGVTAIFRQSTTEQARDLAVGPDGRIFVSGYRSYVVPGKGKKTTTERTGSVVALTSSGALDTTFGDGGYVDNDRGVVYWVMPVPANSSYDLVFSYTMPIASSSGDGGGGKGKKGGGSTTTYTKAIALRRVDADGDAVTSFGIDGELVDDLDVTLDDYATNAEVDAQGRLLVVINQYDPDSGANTVDRLLSRYSGDGTLDSSFGSSGRVSIQSLGTFSDLAIDADGKSIIVCAHDGADDPNVVRYSDAGVAGTSFDVPALADTTNPSEVDTDTKNIVVDASGRVSVCLWYGLSNWDFAIVRCLANGARDTSFGPNGDGIAGIVDLSDTDIPGALVIDGSGRLAIAGQALHSSASQTDAVVVRWLGD